MSGDFSIGTCALLAIRLGSISFGLSLPHVANGCFKAMISWGPVPGIGRLPPVTAQPTRDTSFRAIVVGGERQLRGGLHPISAWIARGDSQECQSADTHTERCPSAADLAIFLVATLIPSLQLTTTLSATYNKMAIKIIGDAWSSATALRLMIRPTNNKGIAAPNRTLALVLQRI
jgi:hypothetical protein